MDEREKVILVGVYLPTIPKPNTDYSLQELERLADTANADVQMIITQQRTRIDSSWYVGKGKIDEIARVVDEMDTDIVIFNTELSSSQVRNIESRVSCKVVDRTQLILDIFASRARSKEGKIQVELAQLNYLLPRLQGKGLSLSRLGGGIGTRGPGETKLETDRRHIRKKISDLRHHLKEIVRHRELYRKRRKKNDLLQVALVGYTNAGKSTLLNQLTNADVLAEDKLFATLDPTSRRLNLPNSREIVFTDTVGFIKDLPHDLVAAFRSTFEEVKEADLILHVIDASHPYREEQMEVVFQLLKEIDAHSIPTLTVFNKSDLLDQNLNQQVQDTDKIFISAFNEQDSQHLLEVIEKRLSSRWQQYYFKIPADRGDLISYIHRNGKLTQETKWNEIEQLWEVNAELDQIYMNKEISSYRVK